MPERDARRRQIVVGRDVVVAVGRIRAIAVVVLVFVHGRLPGTKRGGCARDGDDGKPAGKGEPAHDRNGPPAERCKPYPHASGAAVAA